MKVLKHLSGLLSTLLLLAVLMPLSVYSQSNGENSVAMSSADMDLKWGACPEFMPSGCSIAVLHGDPAKKNVDILFKVPANSDIPNHWHNSAERMILISGTMEVTYNGETTQTLNAGDYAYGPSKKQHTAKCLDNGPCVLFIAFEEPLDAFAVEKK